MNQSSILTACEHVLWHNEHRITASSQQGQKLLNFSANTFKLHNSTTNNNLKNIYVRYEIPECLFMFYFLCFLDDCCNVHNLLLFMLDIV